MKSILSLIPTVFIVILAIISLLSVTARDTTIAEQAWDLHLEKKRSEKEPHETP